MTGAFDAGYIRMLEIMQSDGRISKKALAGKIGLSLTPCFERLRRLENEGFIRSYRGIVDSSQLGSFLWVHTEVTLSRHRRSDLVRFEFVVKEIPEIVFCDAVGGGIDYVLRLVTRDIAHYQRIVDDLLEREVGIEKYYTYIVTKRVKDSSDIPLSSLLPAC